MSDNQTTDNSPMDDSYKKDKIYFSNVFSKVSKSEKNKQYQNLQNGLRSLSKDVRLLEDFANKDNFGKGKKLVKRKGYQYKNFIAKSNFLLRRKQGRHSTFLDIINNYIYGQANKDKSSSKKKGKKLNKSKPTKNLNKSKDHYSIYKTEVDKSSNINRNILPNINFNLDNSSETKMDSITKNINVSNSSTIFPTIEKREPKKLYLYTEPSEKIEKKHKSTKKFNRQMLLPNKKTDLNNNSFIKEFPKIIDKNQRLKSSINRFELSQSTDKMVKKLKEKNQKIKNGINYNLAIQNLIDWEMKSKMKLARWKFGIAEIEKYFVDLKAYGKQEEEELLKRKTFYDIVEELIDEIKESNEEKKLNNIKNKYNKGEKKNFDDFDKKDKKTLDNITRNYNKENKNSKDLDKKDKNKEKNNDINMVDNVINKHSEVSRSLEKIKIRHFNEERTRRKINNILIQSDLSRKAIERSTDKLLENKNKEEMVNVTEEGTNNKIKKKNRKKHHENEDKILIKKENEEEEDHDD